MTLTKEIKIHSIDEKMPQIGQQVLIFWIRKFWLQEEGKSKEYKYIQEISMGFYCEKYTVEMSIFH